MKLPVDVVARLRPRFEGRTVCVTGGAGFIGGHLVDALLALGSTVRVIDDLSSSTGDHLSDLLDLDPSRLRFIVASILDDDALAEAVEGASYVFHQAAIGSVPRSIAEPERSFEVNAAGTLRVLEAARRLKVERVVCASSSSIYGQAGAGPRREDAPLAPVSPYAASKASAEHLCAAWSRSYGLSTISLRYFNVFGPRQPAAGAYAAVIPAFIRRLLAGQPPVIFGDGTQSRDFTFVSNVVLANLLAAAADRPPLGEAVNVGAGRSFTLLHLAGTLARLCGVEHLSPEHQPPRAGDVEHSLADLARAERLLNYRVVCGFEEGLDETVRWHREAMAET